jgi:hypothetical protein
VTAGFSVPLVSDGDPLQMPLVGVGWQRRKTLCPALVWNVAGFGDSRFTPPRGDRAAEIGGRHDPKPVGLHRGRLLRVTGCWV